MVDLKKMLRTYLSKFRIVSKILTSRLFVILLSIIVVGFGFIEFYQYDPASDIICASCHSMTPFRDTLLSSPHSQLSCYKCHETGIVELSNEIYVYLSKNPLPSDIEEGKLLLKDQCLTCHKPQSLQTGLKLHDIHWGLITEVASCTLCHTSHLLKSKVESCLGCHGLERTIGIHEDFHIDADKALARGEIVCQNCHSSNAKWVIPLNYPSVLGAVEGRNCFDCHSAPLRPVNIRENVCLDCHSGGT
ncbi:hypothetical protein ACFL96_09815 [Thermoproteota archaeon]